MRRRIGRPGLVGTMARTAVVAGTATAVNRSMTRAAATREQDAAAAQAYYAQQEAQAQQPAPPPAAAPADEDLTAKLKQLADLHASGVLSDDEFAAAKTKLLS